MVSLEEFQRLVSLAVSDRGEVGDDRLVSVRHGRRSPSPVRLMSSVLLLVEQ